MKSDPAGSTDTFMWTVGREIRVQTPHKSVEPAGLLFTFISLRLFYKDFFNVESQYTIAVSFQSCGLNIKEIHKPEEDKSNNPQRNIIPFPAFNHTSGPMYLDSMMGPAVWLDRKCEKSLCGGSYYVEHQCSSLSHSVLHIIGAIMPRIPQNVYYKRDN